MSDEKKDVVQPEVKPVVPVEPKEPEKPKEIPMLNLGQEHEIIEGKDGEVLCDGVRYKGTIWKQNGIIYQKNKNKQYIATGKYAFTPKPAAKSTEQTVKIPKDDKGNLVFIASMPYESIDSKNGATFFYQHGNKYSIHKKYISKDDREVTK